MLRPVCRYLSPLAILGSGAILTSALAWHNPIALV
jgi:hypothetical protein